MVLDKKKPYGVVTGHAKAAFEQGGKLFDSTGADVTNSKIEAAEQAVETASDTDGAKMFLRDLLRGGPISRDIVIREAEKHHQDFEDVKVAAAQLNVRKYPKGPLQMWKLVEN